MQTIRAAVCRAFGEELSIEEITLRAPTSGEVEVAIEAVAICGSDVSYLDGGFPCSLPAVFGHEAAGRISALGHGVKGLALGDPVVVTLIRSCGTCPSCADAHPAICEAPSNPDATPIALGDGTPLTQGLNCGAFAEKVVVDRCQVVRIPDFVPMAPASLLACGVITGVGSAVKVARSAAGEDRGRDRCRRCRAQRDPGRADRRRGDRSSPSTPATTSSPPPAISAPPTEFWRPSRSPGPRSRRSPAGAG